MLEKIISWDHGINTWVIANQNRAIKISFQIITCLGSGYVWMPVYFIVFIRGSIEARSLIFTIVMAELLGYAIIIVSRNLVPRERPMPKAPLLIPLPWDKNSFPSQHALRAALLAVVGVLAFPLGWPFFICAAVMISFSRIYLQRHYLSDVIVGSVCGAFCALVSLNNF